MAKPVFYIDETAAKALVAGGGVKAASLVEKASSGDFELRFTAVNGTLYVMKSQRQRIRTFAKIETAAKLVRECGLNRFDVEMA